MIESFTSLLVNEATTMLRDRRRLALLFRVYSFIGFLTAIIAIILLLVKKFNITIDPADQPFVVAIVVGLTFGLLSMLAAYYLKEREELKKVSEVKENLIYSLIQSWGEFEQKSQSVLGRDGKGKPMSIRFLIRDLAERGVFKHEQIEKLERVLSMRNMIVHGQVQDFTNSEIVIALQDISDATLQLAEFEHSKAYA